MSDSTSEPPQDGYLVDTTTACVAAHVYGFRGPVPDGHALVVSSDPTLAPVGQRAPRPSLAALAASDGRMIRALEDVIGGLDALRAALGAMTPPVAVPDPIHQATRRLIANRQAMRAMPLPQPAASGDAA